MSAFAMFVWQAMWPSSFCRTSIWVIAEGYDGVSIVLRREAMLEPLDRYKRDSTLFQFTPKRLRDFVGPQHLLVQAGEQFDSAGAGSPDGFELLWGQWVAAIHPEVLVRTGLISSL